MKKGENKKMDNKITSTIENLKKNNFKVTFLEKVDELIPYLKDVMTPSSKVAVGGSMSLFQTGVIDFLRKESFKFLDRYQEGVDVNKIFIESFSAKYYFASANAITERGEIYNTDGNANRVAAISFGPEHVFLIVSTKKIVKNLKEAALRVKQIAAPLNTKRLMLSTPCTKLGHCIKDTFDDEALMTCGQDFCPNSICSNIQILSKQTKKERIEIILIDEDFGY